MTDERKDKVQKATDEFIDKHYRERGASEEEVRRMKDEAADYYDRLKDPDFRESNRQKLRDQGEDV